MNDPMIDQPNDIYAEKALLGAFLIDPGTRDEAEIAGLIADDFYLERHGVIFQAMMDLEILDIITLGDKLAETGNLDAVGGIPYIMELANATASAYNADAYIRIILTKSRMRKALHLASQLVQAINDKDMETVESISAKLADLGANRSTETMTVLHGWDTIDNQWKLIVDAVNKTDERDPSWLYWPDDWKSWQANIRPLIPGRVANISGGGGVGKSAILSYLAENAALQGHQVLFIHLEDDIPDKLRRRMARWSGIPLTRIEDGNLSDDELARLRLLGDQMSHWAKNLHYVYAPGITIAQIEAIAKQYHDQKLCSVLFLDYIDLLSPTRQQQISIRNKYEREEDDMRRLQILAGTLQIPIVVLTQGNKNLETASIVSNVRGSGSRTFMSKLVILLRRPILENETTFLNADGEEETFAPGSRSPYITLQIVKQNRGPTTAFTQFFEGSTFSLYDVATRTIE